MKIEEIQKNSMVNSLSEDIHRIIILFSSSNPDSLWKEIRYFEKNNNDKKSLFRSLYENLQSFEYRLLKLQNNENLYALTWMSNMVSELISKINIFFDKFGINVLEEFQNSYNSSNYQNLYELSQENLIKIISEKRMLNSMKPFPLNEVSKGKHFYNFIISLRNFLIHPNSSKYNFIFFDNFKEIKRNKRI